MHTAVGSYTETKNIFSNLRAKSKKQKAKSKKQKAKQKSVDPGNHLRNILKKFPLAGDSLL
jgi:hypothetical protein